jgi:hypothetical protein
MAKAVVPGFPHHITQRGNDQQAVFDEHDDHFVERIEGLLTKRTSNMVAVSIDRPSGL